MSGPAIVVEPRSRGRWAVQADGSDKAMFVTDRKVNAIDYGRVIARKRGVEFVIKNEAGQIIEKDSHGSDPPEIPG